ncbi:hypothetical protein [Chitinophaga eiseniae]|uniref:Uncharacterized protein n=1 Tax=Chitinophaga eiseniae TaxID=634771 RepID=A0A847SV39_9BACT|nr:hypothetical protein [Chitinophaga eiseniae]NLR81866.1 hypothetical protein [Chitinophaga eiseniae]
MKRTSFLFAMPLAVVRVVIAARTDTFQPGIFEPYTANDTSGNTTLLGYTSLRALF